MSDEFYVGYQPVPKGVKKVVWALSVLVLGAALAAAAVLASKQDDPGTGVWALGQYETYEGVLIEQPYPMLFVNETPHLLFTEGKGVPTEQIKGMHGSVASVRASLIERDGRRALAVPAAEDAVKLVAGAEAANVLRVVPSRETVTLVGEIIDPKCYIGAMKPGGGKTHKACAALCLRSGIPPMFVERHPDGHETYYLLVSGGQDMLPRAIEAVGEPVRVSGELGLLGDLKTLTVSPGAIIQLAHE